MDKLVTVKKIEDSLSGTARSSNDRVHFVGGKKKDPSDQKKSPKAPSK